MGRYRATFVTQPVPATLEDTPWLDEMALVSGSWEATTLDALKRRHHHACTTDASRPALSHWHWIYDAGHQAWQDRPRLARPAHRVDGDAALSAVPMWRSAPGPAPCALPFPDVDTVLWPRLITSVPETTTTLDRAPLHAALGRLLRWTDQDSEQPVCNWPVRAINGI